MKRFFNKLSSVILVATLAGVAIPASAGDRGGNHNFSKSSRSLSGNRMSSMKLGGSQAPKMQKLNLPSRKTTNFKPMKANLNKNVWNQGKLPTKTLPGQGLGNKVVKPAKITKFPGSVIDRGPILGQRDPVLNPFPNGKPPVVKPPIVKPPVNPFPGGKPPVVKPPVVTPPINPFPGGKPPVVKPPIVKPPFNPFPGGKPPVVKPPVVKPPIVNPFPGGKPPIIDPFPGGKPPIDPGPGNGGGGNGGGGNGGGNHGGHCKPRYPWPIFWPVYGGGNYWNSPCYYGPTCTTPTVIVNEVPPVVVNDVVPVSAEVPVAVGTNVADLVLEDVQYVEPATLLVGPAYRIKFRNQGLVAAGAFRVALIAGVDGQADEQSPKAMVEVAGLASGQSSEVTVRLPRTAMQLVNSTGGPTAFTHLLVAADFDNLVSESDKTNNVAIIDRTLLEEPAK